MAFLSRCRATIVIFIAFCSLDSSLDDRTRSVLSSIEVVARFKRSRSDVHSTSASSTSDAPTDRSTTRDVPTDPFEQFAKNIVLAHMPNSERKFRNNFSKFVGQVLSEFTIIPQTAQSTTRPLIITDTGQLVGCIFGKKWKEVDYLSPDPVCKGNVADATRNLFKQNEMLLVEALEKSQFFEGNANMSDEITRFFSIIVVCFFYLVHFKNFFDFFF